MNRDKRTMKTLFALAAAALLGAAALGASTPASKPDAKPSDKGAAKTPASEAKAAAMAGHEHHDMGKMPSKEPNQGKFMTIVGEIMDPACFLEAGSKSIGKGHFQCAVDCARSGQTLAIYDRANDRIYFIAGELPGKNPNDPVMRFIHQKVDVSGKVYHRSDAWGIVITRVVPHVEGSAPASAPAAGK